MCRTAPLPLVLASLLFPAGVVAQAGAIAGRVLGPNNKPVAGATVELVSRSYPGLPAAVQRALPPRGPRFSTRTRTNARGEFHLEPEHPHGIGLHASDAAGNMSSLLAPVLAGDYQVLRLRPAARIRGSLPAPGTVFVEIMADTTDGGAQEFHLGLTTSVRTAADGSYEVLVPSGCNVIVRAKCGDRYTLPRRLTAAEIEAGHRCDLALDTEVLRGQIVGPDARPLAGVLVRDPFWSGTRTHTGGDGCFELTTHRNYTAVHVVAKSYAHGVYFIRPVREFHFARHQRKPDADALKGKKIGLKPGLRLQARVVGPDKRPHANARVVMAGMPLRPRPRVATTLVSWAGKLDGEGKLKMSCVPKDHLTYVFVEVAGEYLLLFDGRLEKDLDLGDVRVPYTNSFRAALQLPDRTPAGHVRVLLRRDVALGFAERSQILPFLELITDRAGRVHQGGLRAGTYEALVDVRGRLPFYTLVTIGGSDGVQQIQVPAGWELRGRVLDEDSEPVPKGTVSLSPQRAFRFEYLPRFGLSGASATTDKEGRFVFRGLPSEVTLQASASAVLGGYAFRTRFPTPVDGEDTDEIELVLNGSVLTGLKRRQ